MTSPSTSPAVNVDTDKITQITKAPRRVVRRQNNSNPLVARRPQRAPNSENKSIVPRGARPPESRISQYRTPSTTTVTPSNELGGSEEEWQTFKLTTTKSSLMKGFRHHVMRLQSKKTVDPTDSEQFTRPIRLHRRDPAAPLQGAQSFQSTNLQASAETRLNPDEKSKQEAEQAQKDAERAATLEKIAPYGGAQKQKQNAFKKKTQQVFKSNEAEKKLRYEEYFPWFIEDFDNKNTWQGQMESQLSNGSYAMFVLDGSNFRMIPIEKWYKFTEKNRFQTLNIEEAEQALKKSFKTPRWVMKLTKQEEKEEAQRERDANMKEFTKGFIGRRGDRLEKILPKSETADADDLDFDDDRFADDEEAPVMEGEEQENKEIEKRIKKEQLSANTFGLRDEKDYEAEQKERQRLEAMKKHGKKVKKYLMRREGNYTYDSEDSDKNPYASTSEDSDDDEEIARKEEERKKEEEQKKRDQEAREQAKGKMPIMSNITRAETKTKTPPVKKASRSSNPTIDKPSSKRMGSPELSESGNEKNRKKPRKTIPNSNGPNISNPNTSISTTVYQKKRKVSPEGSGDDTVGEISDGSNAVKKPRGTKVLANGRKLSPSIPSRQASPVPIDPTRADSPAGASVAPKVIATATSSLIEGEIKAAFKNGPLTTHQVANLFKSRLQNNKDKPLFIAHLKRLTTQRNKKMHLKDEHLAM